MRDGSVVPLRQELVKDDSHVGFEIIGGLASGFVYLIENMNRGGQALLRSGVGHEPADNRQAVENHALTGAGDMGKEAMLNGIVLGTVRWIMGHANRNTDLVGELLQVLFEDVVARVVAATPVTQQQDGGGFGVVELSLFKPSVA